MIRTLALGLTLLLQLITGFAPGGVVLCIHGDGHGFLESAATPCCRVCPRSGEGTEAARAGPAALTRGPGEGEDHRCRDYVLGAPEVRTSTAKAAMTDAGRSGEPIGPAPVVRVASVLSRVLAPGEGTRETGPPLPTGSLALLRSAVLRC